MSRRDKNEYFEDIKKRCDELNYTLLSTEYINIKTKLDIICDKGHEWHHYIDNIKTTYCKESGIYLIRIPYWSINEIENILINELKINEL